MVQVQTQEQLPATPVSNVTEPQSLNVKELKSVLDDKGVNYKSTDKKADLVDKLQGSE